MMTIDPEDQRSVTSTQRSFPYWRRGFSSLHIQLPRSGTWIVHRLHEKLGFKSSCLRWVPHLLTGELRAKRKEVTVPMIPYCEVPEKTVGKSGDGRWVLVFPSF
jgi:hypothetical protein